MSFELIKPNTRINFIGIRYYVFAFSILLILLSLGSVIYKGGLNYGVDFKGGLLMQVRFSGNTEVNAEKIRAALDSVTLPPATIQSFGEPGSNEFLINFQQSSQEGEENFTAYVIDTLNKYFNDSSAELRREEMVGPKVGDDLRQKALYALYYSILMILIYISGRFEKKWATSAIFVLLLLGAIYLASLFGLPISYLIILALVVTLVLCYFFKFEYALGAILALIHDVIITVGVFSILDKEITLSFVAAILTIVGYSLNDSIIIFDRIRENIRKNKKESYPALVNQSINQTLSRTVLTSGSTLMVIACLYLFGGAVNRDFALALFIGIAVGTFSSIFISAPALLFWAKKDA